MYAHQYIISTEWNILKYAYDFSKCTYFLSYISNQLHWFTIREIKERIPTKNYFILATFILIKPVN